MRCSVSVAWLNGKVSSCCCTYIFHVAREQWVIWFGCCDRWRFVFGVYTVRRFVARSTIPIRFIQLPSLSFYPPLHVCVRFIPHHSPFAWCNVCELNGRLAVVCLPFFFYSVCVCVGLIFIGRSELAQFSTIHNFHRAIEQLHMLILISNQSSLCQSVYLPATGTPCCHCTTYDLDTAAVWGTRRFKNETDTIQIGSQHR